MRLFLAAPLILFSALRLYWRLLFARHVCSLTHILTSIEEAERSRHRCVSGKRTLHFLLGWQKVFLPRHKTWFAHRTWTRSRVRRCLLCFPSIRLYRLHKLQYDCLRLNQEPQKMDQWTRPWHLLHYNEVICTYRNASRNGLLDQQSPLVPLTIVPSGPSSAAHTKKFVEEISFWVLSEIRPWAWDFLCRGVSFFGGT